MLLSCSEFLVWYSELLIWCSELLVCYSGMLIWCSGMLMLCSEMLIWYSEMLIWYSRMHRVQILRNGSSKDPQMAYMSQITRYIDVIYFLGSSKKYAAHKCKYHDFNPSKILILAIFGYLHTLMTKNLKNGSSETPQMRYNRYITRYTYIIQSSRLFNQIICSQLEIS